jgi:hypothetical protein
MKIDQIKIKQFGKAAVMFRAIKRPAKWSRCSKPARKPKRGWQRKPAACGGLQSPSGGLPWNA